MNLIRKISGVPRNSTIRFQEAGRFLEGFKGDEIDGKVKVYISARYKNRTVELPADTEVELIEEGKYPLEVSQLPVARLHLNL